MRKLEYRLLVVTLVILLAISNYVTICAASLSLVDTPSAYISESVDSYDVESESNLFGNSTYQAGGNGMWIIDAKMEDSADCRNPSDASDAIHPSALRVEYSKEDVPEKGNIGLKVTRHVNFTLPYDKMVTNKYYLFSFYVYAKSAFSNKQALSCYIGPRSYSGCIKKYEGTECFDVAEFKVGEWTKVSLVFYSGNQSVWTFGIGTGANETDYYYIDDFCLTELPESVQSKAKALDEYDSLFDMSEEISQASSLFVDGDYSGLYSPFLCKKYSQICKELDFESQLKDEYAESGYGYMSYNNPVTSLAEDNLIKDLKCEDAQYWKSASVNNDLCMTSYKGVGYDDSSSLVFSGKGYYIKWLAVEQNTEYYLSLYGMTPADEKINDIHFGIVDSEKYIFENILTDDEAENEYISNGTFQEITINCQDGNWHNRTYRFNTESNSIVGIFFQGSGGLMYFDNICVVKSSQAININKYVVNASEQTNTTGKFICDEANNLIPNGMFDSGNDFWCDDYAFGKFLQVEEYQGNEVLHYKAEKNNCYYIASFPLEKGKNYTFSYWSKVVVGGTQFGVVNGIKPFTYLENSNDSINEWQFHTVTFNSGDEEQVCFVIYDNEGEAYFDKFRLFEVVDGYTVNTLSDVPDSETNVTKISPTTPISNYDTLNSENLYSSSPQFNMRVPDYSFENSDSVEDITPYSQVNDCIVSFSDEGIASKTGTKCLKISEKISMTLPKIEKNKYYILSFYVYCKKYPQWYNYMNIKFRDRLNWSDIYQNSDYASYSDVNEKKWSKVSFVIYSGKSTLIYVSFGEGMTINSTNTFYIDDISLICLPDDVQKAASTVDGYLGDFKENDSFFASGIGDVFKQSDYINLYSPKTTQKYSDLINQMPTLTDDMKYTPEKVENPELISKDYQGVVLKISSGLEYSKDGILWQDSNVFTDLAFGEYNFFQRIKEDEYFNAGEISGNTTVLVVPLGDVNCDFEILADDLVCLRRYLIQTLYEVDKYSSDVNEDGGINIKDLIRLKKILADKY